MKIGTGRPGARSAIPPLTGGGLARRGRLGRFTAEQGRLIFGAVGRSGLCPTTYKETYGANYGEKRPALRRDGA